MTDLSRNDNDKGLVSVSFDVGGGLSEKVYELSEVFLAQASRPFP